MFFKVEHFIIAFREHVQDISPLKHTISSPGASGIVVNFTVTLQPSALNCSLSDVECLVRESKVGLLAPGIGRVVVTVRSYLDICGLTSEKNKVLWFLDYD